ncbi:prefoldin subunit 4 [Geosmithia morbida]|uniref:Prefoldin subunit 4 n=1 Tax=Geosmithia morbida TaxID=1094350 RepID=A0A9P5D4R8_9HYPO|nr:prefoldin subunit 4 [Geosmithia morbida]KAF4126392.1 prefoldin subunit 4 [Geosmithia morbida]
MSGILGRRMLSKAEEEGSDEVEKEKEELDDLSTELELADEDEKIQYKIGDSFFHVPLEQAQEMLGSATERTEEESDALEEKLSKIQDEMKQLKVELYARFGKQINLET